MKYELNTYTHIYTREKKNLPDNLKENKKIKKTEQVENINN